MIAWNQHNSTWYYFSGAQTQCTVHSAQCTPIHHQICLFVSENEMERQLIVSCIHIVFGCLLNSWWFTTSRYIACRLVIFIVVQKSKDHRKSWQNKYKIENRITDSNWNQKVKYYFTIIKFRWNIVVLIKKRIECFQMLFRIFDFSLNFILFMNILGNNNNNNKLP